MKTKGIYFLYRALEALLVPVLIAYFVYRSVRDSAYFTSLGERLGRLPRSYTQTVPGAIWLHAVSVGEVISLQALAARLHQEYPRAPLFVSTGTLAGRALARERLSTIAAGIFHAPVDYAFAVRGVLRSLRPALVVVAETEIWPNLFREVKRSGCGLILLNGRISDRAAPRYSGLRWFFRHVLQWPDAVLVQSPAMRDRYIAAGAPPERVQIAGNLKYDFDAGAVRPSPAVRAFLDRVGPREVWIAASTMPPAVAGDPDEDDAVIEAFHEIARRRPGLLLVLAPRKPERFAAAAEKLRRAGIAFSRRSALTGAGDPAITLPGALLLDSIGELISLFRIADVVFLGGTLAHRGGHNLLEPAFFARAVICGPHLENFREIAEDFRARDALVEITAASDLSGAVRGLLENPERTAAVGARALAAAQLRRGATERALLRIREVEAESLPWFPPPLPARLLLTLLERIWRWASARKRARDMRARRALDVPVISVGNITAGGTGKTPFVVYLAGLMKKAGHQTGIVTRGYRRASWEEHLLLEPGARAGIAGTGDEAQILLKSGVAPVGIGAGRFETARRLAAKFKLNAIVLDDGFQHLRLERRLDIVLIDALDPFGGHAQLPMGRLREPLTSLARAGLFVITRSDCGRAIEAIERRLRQYNPHAPIFHARVVPEHWVNYAGGSPVDPQELAGLRVAAFCGLGNPQSFWSTLSGLAVKPVDRLTFGDHHRYRPRGIHHMARRFAAAGAEAVLTTEKDAVNLCESAAALMAPLRLYWLQIRCQVEREAELLAAVESCLVVFK